jgi:hypothetical protein
VILVVCILYVILPVRVIRVKWAGHASANIYFVVTEFKKEWLVLGIILYAA